MICHHQLESVIEQLLIIRREPFASFTIEQEIDHRLIHLRKVYENDPIVLDIIEKIQMIIDQTLMSQKLFKFFIVCFALMLITKSILMFVIVCGCLMLLNEDWLRLRQKRIDDVCLIFSSKIIHP